VIRPATPRSRPNAAKKNDAAQSIADESAQVTDRQLLIPPINIETSPTPIPASVQHPGSMSRASISSLHPYEDPPRASTDTGDRDSESPYTVRSQDRRSLTSRITGASVKSIRKTLSFRGRRSGEIT
jgi:hypothetical protein